MKTWLTRREQSARRGAVAALLSMAAAASAPAAPIDEIPHGPLTPAGRYADIGGYRIHYVCAGPDGSVPGTSEAAFFPGYTVLLESGIGGAIDGWSAVRTALSPHVRVCAYDRAGYGWSDPGPGPRAVQELAGELHRLVDAAALPGKLVLVGHSFGGFIIRQFADRWPERVAGLVFVDASLTDTLVSIGGEPKAGPLRHPINTNAIEVGRVDDPRSAGGFLNSRRKAIFAQMSEFQNFERSAALVEALGPPTARPVTVLARRGADADAAFDAGWVAAQRRFAGSIRDADFRVVAGSGHNIHEDRPEAVVEAVLAILERAAAGCAGTLLAAAPEGDCVAAAPR